MVASHQGSVTFPGGLNQVFDACMKAVPQCGFRVGAADPARGQIEAKSSIGLRSWGENITITVAPDGRTDIRSACRGIQLVDYGKNKANVTALFTAIGQFLQPQPPQAAASPPG
jgi:hypothetical protein